jgi:hypothetical protein
MDGMSEIVAGNTAYRADGSIYWRNTSVPDGFNAIGNFDQDPFPEVVVVSSGVRLLEHDGIVKWGPIPHPGGGGGPPTVADFDGDGQPEIGVAGASRYAVFETNGTVKWSTLTDDSSSQVTGSSVFDFEGDGAAEVIYGDQRTLRVYRGTTGAVLVEIPNSSCTTYENPVIADADADGNAEILFVANTTCGYGPYHGVFLYGSANDGWVATRKIWNQHTYHITNVNDDGTIPAHETNSWTAYNSYRQNRLTSGREHARPDLIASYARQTNDGTSFVLTARVGNAGSALVAPGLPASFYSGDPTAGGSLLGTVGTSQTLQPGQFQDVSLTVPLGAEALPLWVSADDQGGLIGTQTESDETNNLYNSHLYVSSTPNQAPLVSAGPDQILELRVAAVTLAGTVTDDGLPVALLRITWSQVSGPSNVAFGSPTAAATTATFGAPGTYVLRLSASDDDKSASDDVTVTIYPPNQAPVVSAGPDQSIGTHSTLLDGTATDDGLPAGSSLSYAWTQVAGPAPVTFGSPNAPDTAATFSAAGSYVLRLTASDGAQATSDDVTVDVTFVNQPPVVSAGADQTLAAPTSTAIFTGAATDDGLPEGSLLSLLWSQVAGPSGVVFDTPHAAATAASFPTVGTYVLRLTASDGTLTRSDDVNVTLIGTPASGPPPAAGGLSLLEGQAVTRPRRSRAPSPATACCAGCWRCGP